MEFEALEEDESHLTREEDIDSDKEASPLVNYIIFCKDVLLALKLSVGEDEFDRANREILWRLMEWWKTTHEGLITS